MPFLVRHNRSLRYVAYMIPLFLLFVGIRLPEFSRPHKPKPMRRAMLENKNVRIFQEAIVKIHLEPVVLDKESTKFITTCWYTSTPLPALFYQPFLSITPLPSRAPPA